MLMVNNYKQRGYFKSRLRLSHATRLAAMKLLLCIRSSSFRDVGHLKFLQLDNRNAEALMLRTSQLF